MLVRDPHGLLWCLQRLHESNDSLVFWNTDKSLRLILRGDDDPNPDTMSFDIGLLIDADFAGTDIARIAELEHDAYVDEDVLVYESLTVSRDAKPTDLTKETQLMNRMYEFRACPCGEYVIKDPDHTACARCLLGATPEDAQAEFCCICHRESPRMHMAVQKCCGQRMHRSCLSNWAKTRADAPCPLCRS